MFQNEKTNLIMNQSKCISHKSNLPIKKKHYCSICDSIFYRPSHLKAHMKLHDSNEMKFKCDHCSETFMKQSLLLSHLSKKHKDEEKLFKCIYEDCSKEYSSKFYLDSHITKSHTKYTDEDKLCKLCNKTFSALWLKRQHDEIKHKGNQLYKCLYDNCNKTFSTSSKLQRHSQTHLKEKKFKCQFENCTAEFSRREHLLSHSYIHNEEKTFICDYTNCKASFRYLNNLITHKKFHSKDSSDSDYRTCSNLNSNEESESNSNTRVYNLNTIIGSDSNNNNNNNNDSNSSISISSSIGSTSSSNINDSSIFKCTLCSLHFDSNENFLYHQKTHLDIHKASDKLNDYLELSSISNKKEEEIHPKTNNEINQFINEQNLLLQDEHEQQENEQDHQQQHINTTELNTDDIQQSDDFITFLSNEMNSFDYKQEHIININSDDEEYTTCTVVLENLSGSARTDYKWNHIYIEKYRSKRKQKEQRLLNVKRVKTNIELNININNNNNTNDLVDDYERSKSISPILNTNLISTSPTSSLSSSVSSTTNSLISIKSTLKQTITSKQTPKKKRLSPSPVQLPIAPLTTTIQQQQLIQADLLISSNLKQEFSLPFQLDDHTASSNVLSTQLIDSNSCFVGCLDF